VDHIKETNKGKIIATCTSPRKGMQKKPVAEVILEKGSGIVGDAHAGFMHRQVSLLAWESIEKMRSKGLEVKEGDFAENLTTQGLILHKLSVGTRIITENNVFLRVSQIGKECHGKCAVYFKCGECIMPEEGIFTEVLKGGKIKPGDFFEVLPAYKVGVITVSDKASSGEREDIGGKNLANLAKMIAEDIETIIVPDEKEEIKKALLMLSDQREMDLILTTGGTGFAQRDNTPEITEEIIEKRTPGISEYIRMESARITKQAILSRATSGIRGNTLIINFPGSPKAVEENWEIILPVLPHAMGILKGKIRECARQ